ncbi:MAG: serine protease [Kiritimatiellales bacterium]
MKQAAFFLLLFFSGVLLADTEKVQVEDFLFTVESADGSRGSAFLMKDDDGVWMVSNYHVISGSNQVQFISMNDKERKFELPGEVEIASDRDAIRFRVEDVAGFEMASGCGFDDIVYAFGNSGGLGVITKSKGTVIGKGPDDVEVSCEIIPGNSGGPVINESNQVVGIASYIVKPLTVEISKNLTGKLTSSERARLENKINEVKGTRYEDTRRFAISLQDIVWQKVPIDVFHRESAEFLKQKSLYQRLNIIIAMVLKGTVKIPETVGEPFLENRWVRHYNREIPQSFISGLGRLYANDSWESFYRRYCRELFDMHDRLSEVVDAQQEQERSMFTASYFSNELSEQAELTSKILGMVKMAAEEYQQHR